MKRLLDVKLFLSAQCLADRGEANWKKIAVFCCGRNYGLMTTEDYPFEAVPRPPFTSWSDYHCAGVARYRIKGFKAFRTLALLNVNWYDFFVKGLATHVPYLLVNLKDIKIVIFFRTTIPQITYVVKANTTRFS